MSQLDASEGQRRQVTVLFADIVGFTNIAESLGEERAFDLIRDVTTRMTAIVTAERGTVQEYRGDGIMALYGTPVALEDAPLRACRTALKLRDSLQDMGPALQARYGYSPQLRIGLHSGPVILGEVDDQRQIRMTAVGDTVNLAARLQTEAGPGEILVSGGVAEQVAGQADLIDIGERMIRGKSQPVQVLRLVGLHASVSRFEAAQRQGLSGLVERDRELHLLDAQLAQARDGGVRFVDICGEAGIGKSRLMYEFRQRHLDEGLLILQGDCMADGRSSAFLPFVELVRTSFGISKTDDAAATDRKLRAGLEQIGFDVGENVPYLLTLLGQKDKSGALDGLSADLIGVRMRQLLTDLLWHSCKAAPVLLFVEDLHWIDPGSEDLLHRIAQTDIPYPLLVVCAFRPYYTPPWDQRDNVMRLMLSPLTETGTVRLLSEKLGVTDLAAELVRLAIEKIEGNPLYAEEIAKFLKSRKEAVPGSVLAPGGLVLPANLQNLIMQRFDQLDDQTRQVLHAAAVVGRRFRADLVEAMLGPGVPVRLCLREAEQLEILHPAGSPDADYIFNHALVQDAIYATLMTGQKRTLHARAAEALEARYAGRTEDIAETLAHHYVQTDLHERAIPYLAFAGDRNLKIFSLEVAHSYYLQAIDLLDRYGIDLGPAFLATLLSNMLEVKQWQAAFEQTIQLFEARVPQLAALSDTAHYAKILALTGTAYVQQHRYSEAEVLLEKALHAGEARNEEEAIAYALLSLMGLECVRPLRGSYEKVMAIYDRVSTMTFNRNHLYYQTYARFYLSWILMIRGENDRSIQVGHATIEMGRRENYPGAIGFGSTCTAYIECANENFDRAVAFAEDGIRLAGGAVDREINRGIKGLSLTLGGRAAEGLELLRDVERVLTEMKFFALYNIIDMPIGVALASVGELAAGFAWLEKATTNHMRTLNTHGAALTHVVTGEIYRQMASGSEKPSAAMLRRNFWFLLRRLPFARRHALRHYDEAVRICREADMYGVAAQALLGKARVLRQAKQTKAAARAIAEAQEALAQIRWDWLSRQIAAEEAALTR